MTANELAQLDQHMSWLAQANSEVHAYRARMSVDDQHEHMKLDIRYGENR